MPQSWYSIRNAADSVEISIYEEIGFFGVSAKSFLDELKAVGPRPITLRLNSPGGAVVDGLAIYNRLREHAHASDVVVKIDGLAASMASVVAMAGNRIEMAENALLMLHNPSGLVAGDADDMRDVAEILDKMKSSLLQAYERKTRMPRNKLAKMMDAETWLTAQEALDHGFIDAITESLQLAARFDSTRLPNMPAPLAAKLHPKPTMILNASILTLLATASGLALNAESQPAEIEQAITALGQRHAQLESDLTAARATHAAITTERDTLQAQFTALAAEATQAQADLATATASLASLTSKATALEASLAAEKTSVTRLEALCGVKGIDPKDAIPNLEGGPAGRGTPTEQYVAAVNSGDKAKRLELLKAHRREITAELARTR